MYIPNIQSVTFALFAVYTNIQMILHFELGRGKGELRPGTKNHKKPLPCGCIA